MQNLPTQCPYHRYNGIIYTISIWYNILGYFYVLLVGRISDPI